MRLDRPRSVSLNVSQIIKKKNSFNCFSSERDSNGASEATYVSSRIVTMQKIFFAPARMGIYIFFFIIHRVADKKIYKEHALDNLNFTFISIGRHRLKCYNCEPNNKCN